MYCNNSPLGCVDPSGHIGVVIPKGRVYPFPTVPGTNGVPFIPQKHPDSELSEGFTEQWKLDQQQMTVFSQVSEEMSLTVIQQEPTAQNDATVLQNYSFKGPGQRHLAAKVNQKSVAKETNTVAEPWVNMGQDVAVINAGQALKSGETFTVDGRTYGYHDNVLYPVSGEGFHQLDRGSYKALGVYNTFGVSDKTTEILKNMEITNEASEAALTVWRALNK